MLRREGEPLHEGDLDHRTIGVVGVASIPRKAAVAGGVAVGATVLGVSSGSNVASSLGGFTPWLVAFAGLADGFNPCSFAGLLVFASLTTAAFERETLACHATDFGPSSSSRLQTLRNGSVYISALFLTYMALGLGLLSAMSFLTEGHWAGKAASLLSMGMGVWVLRDAFFPESRWKLEMPKIFRLPVHKAVRATLLPAVFSAGILVGLCTVPCTGGIYLGVLGLLASQGSAIEGMGLLLLYNVMFVVPLVTVVTLATSRSTYRAVARWHLRTKNLVKTALGTVMIGLSLVTLLLLT